jgi:hypothetical protein
MFIAVIYINAIPMPSIDLETENNKLSDALMVEKFGAVSHYYLTDPQYDADNINDDETHHQKRQLKRKWAAIQRGPHSPYKIAFPALIRSRRWIEREQ